MPSDSAVTPPDPSWFRDVVESAVDYAIISMDERGVIFAWSPGATRLFCYTEEEVLGRPAELIFTAADIRSGVAENERVVAIRDGSCLDERWHVRKDGTQVWASGKLIVVRSRSGRVRGLVKIIRDRTREKATHDALRQTEERYQLLGRATNDIVWDWDLLSNTLSWNEAVETHFGVSAKAFGENIEDWKMRLHPNDRDRVVQGLQAAINDGATTWSDRYEFLGKDGKYETFFDRGTIARDETGRPIRMIGSMLNITHDRRAENSLREAQARIERQNAELEARVEQRTRELTAAINHLEEFSYSMSHDLKGPAHTIRALVEILLDDQPSPTERGDILQRIHRNAVSLLRLINEMLRFSEIGLTTPRMERVDLDSLVDEVVAESLKPDNAAASRIEIRRPLHAVLADRKLLWPAVHHLVGNALKFVAPGEHARVSIWTEPARERVRLRVEDKGIGIEPRYRDQIFELFRRLHHPRSYPGYGVGLATVKRAVEKMSGTVSFSSVVGQGTVFTLDLPAPPAAVPPAAKEQP